MTATTLAQRAAATHAHLLAAASEVEGRQLVRWLAPNVPSIGWHLWHIARWADRVQAMLPAMLAGARAPKTPRAEIWETDSLAARWELDAALLGYGQTGMEMGDAAASALRLPERKSLLDYAQRAFTAAEMIFAALDEDGLAVRGPDVLYAGRVERERSVCDAVLGHITHASRHLGTMEGIRPLLLQKPGSMTF